MEDLDLGLEAHEPPSTPLSASWSVPSPYTDHDHDPTAFDIFAELPIEVSLGILSFVPFASLGAFAQVSRACRRILSYDQSWFTIFYNNCDGDVQAHKARTECIRKYKIVARLLATQRAESERGASTATEQHRSGPPPSPLDHPAKLLLTVVELGWFSKLAELLHHFEREQQLDIKQLLEHDVHQHYRQSQALNEATSREHTHCVKILLAYGADCSKGALNTAIRKGRMDMVEWMLVSDTSVQLNSPDELRLLLCLGIKSGRVILVQRLLQLGADLNAPLPRPPVCEAAAAGSLEMVEFLIRKRADPHAKCSNGRSALNLAACQQHHGIVELLLSLGLTISQHDMEKLCSTQGAAMVEVFLARGAPVSLTCGKRALKHHTVLEALLRDGRLVELDRSSAQRPLLHMALADGYWASARVLEQYTDPLARAPDGSHLLHAAMQRYHYGTDVDELVYWLSKYLPQFDVNELHQGATLAKWALQQAPQPVLVLLKEAGARLVVPDDEYQTFTENLFARYFYYMTHENLERLEIALEMGFDPAKAPLLETENSTYSSYRTRWTKHAVFLWNQLQQGLPIRGLACADFYNSNDSNDDLEDDS